MLATVFFLSYRIIVFRFFSSRMFSVYAVYHRAATLGSPNPTGQCQFRVPLSVQVLITRGAYNIAIAVLLSTIVLWNSE